MADRGALPWGHNSGGKRIDPPVPAVPSAAGYGQGGIVSNGQDMLAYLRYCMGLNVAAPYYWDLQNERANFTDWCDQSNPYTTGYGWFIQQSSTSPSWQAWKDGAVPGFTSWMVVYWPDATPTPPNGYGMFVLVNTWQADTCAQALTAKILPLLLPSETPPELVQPGKRASTPGLLTPAAR